MRKDGRWQGALQIAGRRVTVYGSHRLEVVERLRDLTAQAKHSGRLPEEGRLTLGQFLHDWLERSSNRLRPTTQDGYRVIVEKYLAPGLGHIRLNRLDAFTVGSFYSSIAKSLSKRRMESIHGVLHKALADAHRWGLVPNNAASLVDAPRRERPERSLWDVDQARLFLDAVLARKGGVYSPLFAFLLGSGCRLGESLGLQWSDIGWQEEGVKVERQIVEVRGVLIESEPKTKSGVRWVSLPGWAMNALECQRSATSSLGHGTGPADRVFVSTHGGVPSRRNVRRALDGLQARLALPRLTVHGLRHMAATLLLSHGVPLTALAARLGHSDVSVTSRVYAHNLRGMDAHAADVMERLLEDDGGCGRTETVA